MEIHLTVVMLASSNEYSFLIWSDTKLSPCSVQRLDMEHAETMALIYSPEVVKCKIVLTNLSLQQL